MIKVQSRAASKDSSESFGKAIKMLDRTLQCLKIVGGIVADGASSVRPNLNRQPVREGLD